MLELNKIYCGDCLPLMKEMPDKSVDLVLTDPPYSDNFLKFDYSTGRKHKGGLGGIKHHFISPHLSEIPDGRCFLEMYRVSKNQIIWGGNYFALFPSSCWLVWDKENTANFADAELAWTSFQTAVRIFKYKWSGMLQGDMSHKEIREHPTQKPLPLMMWCIENYTKPGDTVLDPFMGSGTTCVACKKLGRNYIGIDKEPQYVAIAEKRLEKVNNHKLTDFFGVGD